MLRGHWVSLLMAPTLALWACGDNSTVTPTPLEPSVSAISPTSAVAGSADLPVTIEGHNFVVGDQDGSKAAWLAGGDTTLLATHVVSTTQLTALVPAGLMSKAVSAQILVQTGDPTGGAPLPTSNAVSFTVTPPPPKGGGE
jgi:hypothetical protein